MDITFLLFDGLTVLDAIGPYEVLHRVPDANVQLAAKSAGPITTENVLTLSATHALADVTRTDVLVVPGGFATQQLEHDPETLDWIRAMDATSTWTTSVCTGSMVLAAAGLLGGKRATTHWAWLDRLAEYGAIPTSERVVEQGKILTAAGVSAGIDMGLTLAARLSDDVTAQAIQLGIEYDPQPPFDAGALDKAPQEAVEILANMYAARTAATS
jgi:putative intracellular protease/amidase